jgi:hypothetical protein
MPLAISMFNEREVWHAALCDGEVVEGGQAVEYGGGDAASS